MSQDKTPTKTPGKHAAEPLAVYLVKGDDPSLVGEAVRGLLAELVGDRPAPMVVEELGGDPQADDIDAGPVLDALSTPPFLTDRRVVVVRDAGRMAADEGARLAAWLADPAPGVTLVLAAWRLKVPASLVKATPKGGVIDSAMKGQARKQWFADRVRQAPVRLDARAAHRLEEHLGEDMARLEGVLGSLASAYGDAPVGLAELEPLLGEAGGVAPWDLTDAVDGGDISKALQALGRMLGSGGKAPLAVLFGLHRHYEAMLRLDGAEAASSEEAAELIGARSAFVARKALNQGRRLGSAGVRQAVVHLAQADLDLRGESAAPDDMTLQVLVARLSRLAGPPRASR